MKQQPGKTITSFLSEMHYVWDQLTSFEPEFTDATNANKFFSYRDRQRLVLFLMDLIDDFEHVRASLLHRSPLPTLNQAVTELLSKETRLGPHKTSSTDNVLATTRRSQSKGHYHSSTYGSSKQWCNYCKKPGHTLLDCRARTCKYCQKQGPGHLQYDCPQNPARHSQHFTPRGGPSKSAATTAEHSTSIAFAEEIGRAHV